VSPSVFQRAAATTNKAEKINKGLIPKRAPGDNQDAFDVLEDGVMVGRIFLVSDGPPNTLWMWASGHNRDNQPRSTRLRGLRWQRSPSPGRGCPRRGGQGFKVDGVSQ
jgi:hypothetical protein